MKKLRNLSKIIAVVALIAMVMSFASCKPKLKLESFTVDGSSVKTTYVVGEEVDFSGIKAYVKYNDETLNKTYTYGELTLSYANNITAEAGTKTVTVSFKDPNLDNVEQKTTFDIKVTAEPEDNVDPQVVVQFEKPGSLNSFDSDNAAAGTSQYGAASFSGEFAIGGQTYVIGNENEFKLNPAFSVMGDDDVVKDLDAFFSVVEISIYKEGAYVALTATKGEGNMVSFADGDKVIANVDTYSGKYYFTADAEGQKVKISILPSEEYYIFESFNPVVLEAKIIKAYNVYEAWQLAVIDNSNAAWTDIKTKKGLLNVSVSGIVLHADISLTAEDAPASFFYTTTKEITYTNATDPTDKKTIPAGTKYLKDGIFVYERIGDSDFVIQGNFFNLDTSAFPLVPSPGVFASENKDYHYGVDFSNAALFRFESTLDEWDAKPDNVALINIENISLIGNAARNNYVDSEEGLASAGGLIFVKSSHHAKVTIDNTIGNSYFITYFADYGGDIYATNVKCYDSYQNAGFCWSGSILSIEDSWIDGCGGPAIISMSVENNGTIHSPVTEVKNTKVVTSLAGEEVWFNAIGATELAGQFKGLGSALESKGLGNFVKDNKMNIKGVLMAEGNDPTAIISATWAEGSIFFEGKGIDRFLTAENVHWATINGITGGVMQQSGSVPPFLTVNVGGKTYSAWTDGTNLYDLTIPNPYPTPVTPDTHEELLGAFMAADTITLTQGGISVVFEFHH